MNSSIKIVCKIQKQKKEKKSVPHPYSKKKKENIKEFFFLIFFCYFFIFSILCCYFCYWIYQKNNSISYDFFLRLHKKHIHTFPWSYFNVSLYGRIVIIKDISLFFLTSFFGSSYLHTKRSQDQRISRPKKKKPHPNNLSLIFLAPQKNITSFFCYGKIK